MIRAFCPTCGDFSFGYDPEAKAYRCYNVKCEFVDIERKYGEGLSENPFSKYEPIKLEFIEKREMDKSERDI